jgi:Alcohol dehydrogenase GroES-like domain
VKALVKKCSEPGLWLEDIPEPEFGIHDVKIRIRRTGICGTDLHIYEWDGSKAKKIPILPKPANTPAGVNSESFRSTAKVRRRPTEARLPGKFDIYI